MPDAACMLCRESLAEEKARIRALKSNDIEAYRRLLATARNERLEYLMSQTDSYLKN